MRNTALNSRSEYALDGGLVRIDALLDRVRQQKMNAAGLVDRASLLGIPHFLSGAHRRGLRVVLGAELPVLSSSAAEAVQGVTYPLVVYATSPESLGRLARLVSRAHERGWRAASVGPHLLWNDLLDTNEDHGDVAASFPVPPLSVDGLIAQSPGQTGEVSVRILRGQMDQAEWLALRLAEVFGRSFFQLGITLEGRVGDGSDATRTEFRLADETTLLARRLGLPVIASNVVEYLDPDDAVASARLGHLRRQVGQGEGEVASAGSWSPGRAGHLRTPAEFAHLFRHHTEALAGLDALTERAALEPARFRAPVASGTSRVEPGSLEAGRSGAGRSEAGRSEAGSSEAREVRGARCAGDAAIDRLAARVAGGTSLHGAGRSRQGAAERRRLHEELALLRAAGLAPLLLALAQAFEAGRERTSPRSGLPISAVLRRGPVSGSLVAHRLGLTPVNPLEAGLSFRISGVRDTGVAAAEDLLIEVAEADQAAWLEGLDSSEAVRAGRFTRLIRFDAFEALRDVGLATGVPAELLRRAARVRSVPTGPPSRESNAHDTMGTSAVSQGSAVLDPIAALFRNDPHLARAYQRDGRVRVWFDTARRIVGFPRLATTETRARILGLRDDDAAPADVPRVDRAPGWFPSAPGMIAHRPTGASAWHEPRPGSSRQAEVQQPEGQLPAPPQPVIQWTGEHSEFGCALFHGPFALIRVVGPPTYDLQFLLPEDPARHDASNDVREDSLMSAQFSPVAAATPVRGASISPRPLSDQPMPARSGIARGLRRPHPADSSRTPSLHAVAEAIALERLAPQRPGLAERFVRRRSGQEAFQILDAGLEPILADTFGLLIHEEQVVDIAVRVAAFSAAEAECFRRDIAGEGGSLSGPSARAVALTAWRIRFVRGAVDRGVAEQRAEDIFAGLLTAGAVTVNRAECVTEAMRLLREAHGFGAARDGRSGGTPPPGVTPLPLPRRQFVLPWLESSDAAAELSSGSEEAGIRRRA